MASGEDIAIGKLARDFDELEVSRDQGGAFIDKIFFLHKVIEGQMFSLVRSAQDFSLPPQVVEMAKTAVSSNASFCGKLNAL